MTDFLKIAKSIAFHFAHICAYGVETVKQGDVMNRKMKLYLLHTGQKKQMLKKHLQFPLHTIFLILLGVMEPYEFLSTLHFHFFLNL